MKNSLWANVYDSPDYREKWGVDNKTLAEKMRGMTMAEKYATVELVRWFWGTTIYQTVKPGQALEALIGTL